VVKIIFTSAFRKTLGFFNLKTSVPTIFVLKIMCNGWINTQLISLQTLLYLRQFLLGMLRKVALHHPVIITGVAKAIWFKQRIYVAKYRNCEGPRILNIGRG
jgi:hypothetical protein